MRILVASVDSLPSMGGISLMAHHLANALYSLGHSVVYLGPKGTFVPSEFQRAYALVEDLQSRSSARGGAAAAREDRRLRLPLARVFEQHRIERVLLLHPYYYGIPLLEACAAYDARLSVYFHGFELRSQMAGDSLVDNARIVADGRIETLRDRVFNLIGSADEILTNSHYTLRLLDGFTQKPRVRATGCGIPQVVLSREVSLTPVYNAHFKATRRRELGLPDAPCVCYIGRLVETKRVDRVLELCASSGTLSALILGDGPELDALRARAEALGIADRTRFLGAVSEVDKWRYLRAADFLALLSEPDEDRGNVEGFGIALLEGAAAGAVPVTSGTGGMIDVVADGQTGIVVTPGTVDAGKLLGVLSSPNEMSRLVDAARDQLRAKYTWEAVAKRISGAW